jgi:hypothetical protein
LRDWEAQAYLYLFIFWENSLFVRGYLEFRWDGEFEMVFVLKQKGKHIFLVTQHVKLLTDERTICFLSCSR